MRGGGRWQRGEEGEAAEEKGAGHIIVRISTDSFSVLQWHLPTMFADRHV